MWIPLEQILVFTQILRNLTGNGYLLETMRRQRGRLVIGDIESYINQYKNSPRHVRVSGAWCVFLGGGLLFMFFVIWVYAYNFKFLIFKNSLNPKPEAEYKPV